MLKRGSAHLRALSMNEVPAKSQKTPRSSLLKSRGDTSLCIDVQRNSILLTTADTEDTFSTKITRTKASLRTLISQRATQRQQNNKTSSSSRAPVTPVLGIRNIILPSFQSQKHGDVRTPTWKDISDFSQFQTINYGLAFLERKRMFEAAKIKEKRFYSQTRHQTNPLPKNLKQLQKNLFKINKSKKNFDDVKAKEMLCPHQDDTRTVSSFHREQSISALSPSRTNIFDSVRASSSRVTSADLGDRLKEIDDLNDMMEELEIMKVNTEYNHDFDDDVYEKKAVVKKSKKRLDYLQTESSSAQKQYLNLGQLLDTEESAGAAPVNTTLPKIYVTSTSTTTTTPKVCFNRTGRDLERENFKKMINKGIGRDPQCRMDPSLLVKMNQDRLTFEKRLRRITQKI